MLHSAKDYEQMALDALEAALHYEMEYATVRLGIATIYAALAQAAATLEAGDQAANVADEAREQARKIFVEGR